MPACLADEPYRRRSSEITSNKSNNMSLPGSTNILPAKPNVHAHDISARSPLTDEERYRVLWLTMTSQKKQRESSRQTFLDAAKRQRELEKANELAAGRVFASRSGPADEQAAQEAKDAFARDWEEHRKQEKVQYKAFRRLKKHLVFVNKVRLLTRRTRLDMQAILKPKVLGPCTMRRLERSESTPTGTKKLTADIGRTKSAPHTVGLGKKSLVGFPRKLLKKPA